MEQKAKMPLTPEEKKQKSKNRIFGLMVILDIVLALLIVYEIVDLFLISWLFLIRTILGVLRGVLFRIVEIVEIL